MAAAVFPHFGDLHVNPGPRNADRYRALDQAIEECLALPRLSAWFFPGDLAHARQSISDKNELAARLQRMADRAPVVVVQGNHDQAGDLDLFAQLGAKWPIAVVTTIECIRTPLATGEWLTAFCIAYPSKGGLVAQGIAPADVVNVAGDLLEPIILRGAHELELARKRGDVCVVLGHLNVSGSLLSSGQPNVGHELELSPRHLDHFRCYCGFNHIHRRQTVGRAHYAGSMCRLDWGETDDKAYSLVIIDGDDVQVAERPINVPPMFHVEGSLSREGFALDDSQDPDVVARYSHDDWSGCEVRVRYIYRQSEKAILDEALVHARFASALRLKIEPVAIPDRAVRAPAVAAALTLPDKIAAWAEAVGTTPAPTLVEKLALLEHTDPSVLLENLRASLAALDERMEVAA